MRFAWVCRRLAPFTIILVIGTATLGLMLRWGLFCINLHTIQYINNLCTDYMSGEAIGNLCEPLCVERSIDSLTCHPTYQTNGAFFSAIWKGKQIVFKTPKKTSLFEFELLHWEDTNNGKQYPTTEEFVSMIRKLVMSKINISLSNEEAREISQLPGEGFREEELTPRRMLTMDSLWLLLQDNEYLYTVLFEKHDIFPKYLGICGSLYAVEKMEIVKGTSALFSLEDTDEEWERRTLIAAQLLDLLTKFDLAQLQLCDVQLKNFGSLEGHLKYLSPEAIRQRGDLPIKKFCRSNHDCSYLDCRGKCNTYTGYCEKSIEHDNLQKVCEKIYLGWTATGRVLLPGLLVSTKASSALSVLLRQCADPNFASRSSILKQSLYNTLVRKS